MTQIRKIHHVAYRCVDAKETVEWYGKYLNMDFVLAIAENQVPSTGEPDPYMHVFLDAGGGNILAFFELPTKAPMGRDPNTPAWVQHLAMQVDSVADLVETKARLEADGIDVVGPTDHTIFKSTPAVIASNSRPTPAPRRWTPASTKSSGTCSTNGLKPARHPSMRAGCTTAAWPLPSPKSPFPNKPVGQYHDESQRNP